MPVIVELPAALRPFAGGAAEVALPAGCATVGEALNRLAARHAGVVDRVRDERGAVRPHVNVFVDGENIRFLDGLATPVGASAVIVIVPSVSGG